MQNESNTDIKETLISKEEKDYHEPEAPQEERKIPPAPFFALFKYTTSTEKIKLIFGTISAIAAGAALPFFLLFFADITTVFDERNRGESVAKGWELCYKFFIVGAATWVTRTYILIQTSLEHTTGIWWDQNKLSESRENTSRHFLTNKSHGTMRMIQINW